MNLNTELRLIMSDRVPATSRFYGWTVHLDISDDSPYYEQAKNWTPQLAFNPPNENIRFSVCQLEVGKETNKAHYQGFTILINPIRGAQLKNYLQAPWANFQPKKAEAVDDMIAYCTKEDTRVEGAEPFIIGELPKKQQGKRNDLLSVHENIKSGMSLYDIANANPVSLLRYTNNIRTVHSMFMAKRAQTSIRNVQVEVLIGPPGVGKTQYVFQKNGMENCYTLNTKAGQTVWWDNYEGQKCIILDDFYGAGLSWQEFLRIMDKYPLQLQVKGSTTWASFTKVYITSNRDWFQWYPGQIKGSQWKNQIGALYRRFSKILIFRGRDSAGKLDILEEEIMLNNNQPVLPPYVQESKDNLQEDGTWVEDYKPTMRLLGTKVFTPPDDVPNWDGSTTTNVRRITPTIVGEIKDEDISDAESLRSEPRSEEDESEDNSFIVSDNGDDDDDDIIIHRNKRIKL